MLLTFLELALIDNFWYLSYEKFIIDLRSNNKKVYVYLIMIFLHYSSQVEGIWIMVNRRFHRINTPIKYLKRSNFQISNTIICPFAFENLFHPNKTERVSSMGNCIIDTAWKVLKSIVFSAPYFPALILNTEIFRVNFTNQSECGKIWTKWNS